MINLCQISCQNSSVDVAAYFVILSCGLHLTTAFCTVALMKVYTAEYLLVLADSGTAGIKNTKLSDEDDG